MKILVVDDSPVMRRIVIQALKKSGYDDFTEAENGKEAYAILALDQSFEFMITDWNMPVLSGLELIKKVRAHPHYNDLPILMVTTRGNKNDIIDALKAKVSNYIVKPFTPKVLQEKMDQILKKTQR